MISQKGVVKPVPCPQCGDRMFPSIFDNTQNYCVMCNKNFPRRGQIT